jgi:16S rRNA (adenine1518-N6/adenine1519-N6)-dimethyltransferase
MGQHILVDMSVLEGVIGEAALSGDDRVVEIGAGTGVLTAALAPRVKHLTALETDHKMCRLLSEKLSGVSNLEIINADALNFDYGKLQAPFKVVGNLPYYIAATLLLRLLESRERISDMTLMFQDEVARRLSASAGNKNYGALTIKTQYYADVEKRFTVPPWAFRPPPKVNSAVIKVTPLERPKVSPMDRVLFFKLVESAFAQRRKTLMNCLLAGLAPSVEKPFIEKVLKEAGIHPRRRGEELSIYDFSELSDTITKFRGT